MRAIRFLRTRFPILLPGHPVRESQLCLTVERLFGMRRRLVLIIKPKRLHILTLFRVRGASDERLISGIVWLLAGVLFCITIIGIPFGLQCFKYMRVTMLPFGKVVVLHYSRHIIVNTIWLIFFGWEMAIGYLLSMAACAVTIVGIPAAIALSKVMLLSIAPFGADVY